MRVIGGGILKDNSAEIKDFVLEGMPVGAIVFNRRMDIIYLNRKAELFLKRHRTPDEIRVISERIFSALESHRFDELFPGEIVFQRKFEESPSAWIFKFGVRKEPVPCISIFISELSTSSGLDLNAIRRQYRLTRRETDVVRRVVDGLKNLEIAEELNISEQTVKDHLSNVYMKMDVQNRLGLVSLVLKSTSP
jgi:DNA-binding CsgD family transcriptional regulator